MVKKLKLKRFEGKPRSLGYKKIFRERSRGFAIRAHTVYLQSEKVEKRECENKLGLIIRLDTDCKFTLSDIATNDKRVIVNLL